jgi:predicted dehydrogenase
MEKNIMEKLRVGVIGYGYWGPNLTRNFQELPLADLVAVADLKEERRQQARSKYPQLITMEDYKELFGLDLDAVVISTPPVTHHQIARECLEHNLHVLIEKPMTLNSRDAEDLIQLADSKGLTLMVGHTFEYNSAVFAMKKLIDSGELGRIYYLDAARLNLGLFQRNSNVLWDLAPHDISILLYLLDQDPISVSAQGMACVFEGIYDVAYVNLIFPGNVPAYIHVSWLDPCKVRRITVVGSKKMAVLNDVENEQKIKIYDKGVDTPAYTNGFEEFQCSYRSGDILIPKIRFVEPLRQECQVFLERCLVQDHKGTNQTQSGIATGGASESERAPQVCSIDSNCSICNNHQLGSFSCGRDGLRVVKILEAAQQSMINGQTAEVLKW